MRKAAQTAAFVVAVLGLMWAWMGFPEASAQATDAQFSIAVSGVPGCDSASGSASCDLAPGSTFGVEISLDGLPAATTSYLGFDIMMEYAGVVPEGQPSTNAWPQCSYPAFSPRPERLLFGCAAGLPPNNSSSYTGVIGVATFRCAESGAIRLLHAAEDTNLSWIVGDDAAQSWDSGSDELTINCVSGGAAPAVPTPVPPPSGQAVTPPGGTEAPAEPTATAPTASTAQPTSITANATPTGDATGGEGGDDGDDDGLSGGVIAAIVIAVIAGISGLGFVGWRVLQGRQGTDGNAA